MSSEKNITKLLMVLSLKIDPNLFSLYNASLEQTTTSSPNNILKLD